MMEKVKLTVEQQTAIQTALDSRKGRYGALLEAHTTAKGFWTNECKPLNDLSMDELARALYVGYEVEKPKFQSGDKILLVQGDRQEVLTLSHITRATDRAWKVQEAPGWLGEEDFRLATPEEIYWYETLGREKIGDFRIGDTILTAGGALVRITTEYILAQADSTYSNHPDEFAGVYPDESFKQFPEEETK